MGFVKKTFKRKVGGTFVGNLIRGAANKASGGILGNGAQMKKAPTESIIIPDYKDTQAYKSGQNIGTPINEQINNLEQVKNAKNQMIMEYLKTNWIKLLIPTIAVIAIITYILKRPKTNSKIK